MTPVSDPLAHLARHCRRFCRAAASSLTSLAAAADSVVPPPPRSPRSPPPTLSCRRKVCITRFFRPERAPDFLSTRLIMIMDPDLRGRPLPTAMVVPVSASDRDGQSLFPPHGSRPHSCCTLLSSIDCSPGRLVLVGECLVFGHVHIRIAAVHLPLPPNGRIK